MVVNWPYRPIFSEHHIEWKRVRAQFYYNDTSHLPIGSAGSADAEREKRSQRLGDVLSRVVQGFKARNFF
jgi:hypothetical protein